MIETGLTDAELKALQQPEYRVFPKRWGAEYVAAGEVRFALWAPGLSTLSLWLNGETTPMSPVGDGWFELLVTGVVPGSEYAFILPEGMHVPDPAGRALKHDVHGTSLIVDPTAYQWRHTQWRGRPWHEAVVCELHVGTFTDEGTFAAAAEKLADLAATGITVIELMPVAAFSGQRGWGYDGVLLYTPYPPYGSPDDLKALIDRAHGLGLMVILDVVYNHLGVDGNYLSVYAPEFFQEKGTPWGQAIDFSKSPCRDFIIENALYWIEEYAFDGLRIDAANHILDDRSELHLVEELAQTVREVSGERHIHLVFEDGRNQTSWLERDDERKPHFYDAVWNDGYHHLLHAWAANEPRGHYKPFASDVWTRLGRALATGFVFQGEPVEDLDPDFYGEPSGHLPPTAFVNFLQNHDQIGNRAFGERFLALVDQDLADRLMAMLLLAPQIPLLFMGETYGSRQSFFFFSDYPKHLTEDMPKDRLEQARGFGAHGNVSVDDITDPTDRETFIRSKLDWGFASTATGQRQQARIADLITKRQNFLVPLLAEARGDAGEVLLAEDGAVAVDWRLGKGLWQLRANFSDKTKRLPRFAGAIIHADGLMETLDEKDDIDLPGASLLFARQS